MIPLDPYCGPAPTPEIWLAQWNLDPLVIAPVMLGMLLAVRTRPGWAVAAAFVLLAAFVSPLCALASALFSARVLHHILLIAFAAPLIVLALPRMAQVLGRGPASPAFALHMALVWLWHAPVPYHWALSSDPAYWVMELSLLGSAIWLWAVIMAPGRVGTAISVAMGSAMQMGLLGALLVFASGPLYAAHFASAPPFGLSATEDQQLAGVLMWVPAALPYLAAVLWRIAPLIQPGRAV